MMNIRWITPQQEALFTLVKHPLETSNLPSHWQILPVTTRYKQIQTFINKTFNTVFPLIVNEQALLAVVIVYAFLQLGNNNKVNTILTSCTCDQRLR